MMNCVMCMFFPNCLCYVVFFFLFSSFCAFLFVCFICLPSSFPVFLYIHLSLLVFFCFLLCLFALPSFVCTPLFFFASRKFGCLLSPVRKSLSSSIFKSVLIPVRKLSSSLTFWSVLIPAEISSVRKYSDPDQFLCENRFPQGYSDPY